jgi:hypothetical protein
VDEGVSEICYFSEGVGYTHFVLVLEKMLNHIHFCHTGSKRIHDHDCMVVQEGSQDLLLAHTNSHGYDRHFDVTLTCGLSVCHP